MKIVLSCLFLLLGICTTQAQTVVYDENAEIRKVPNFTGIEISGTLTVYIIQGAQTGVAVSAGEMKYNEKIKTEVVNGILKLSVDGGIWNTFSLANKKLKAYVSVAEINRLEVAGASYAKVDGILKANNLHVNISGVSELSGKVQVDKLNLEISGASVARLTGVVSEGLVEASGACKFNSYDLAFKKLKANATGASQVRTTVTNELVADATGGSTIYFKGEGTAVRSNATDGASIKKKSGSDD